MKNFDSIFNDVVENAKTAAAAVSVQAAKIYDASKHRISAETIKRTIGKKLIELGRLTYKATTQDIDLAEDIARIVEEITELKQNLAIIEAHIASIKNQKICPECRNKVTMNSVFCNICGYKFPEEIPEEAAEEEPAAEQPEQDEQKAEGEAAEKAVKETDEIAAAAKEAVEDITVDAAEEVAKAEEAEAAEAAEE